MPGPLERSKKSCCFRGRIFGIQKAVGSLVIPIYRDSNKRRMDSFPAFQGQQERTGDFTGVKGFQIIEIIGIFHLDLGMAGPQHFSQRVYIEGVALFGEQPFSVRIRKLQPFFRGKAVIPGNGNGYANCQFKKVAQAQHLAGAENCCHKIHFFPREETTERIFCRSSL